MIEEFSRRDMEQNKIKAGLGYLVFFLPLILCKDSKLGRHCANQGLLLLIVTVLATGLLGILAGIPLLGWIFSLAARLVRFVLFLLGLLCFLQLTTNERAVELPVIGSFRIIR